MLEKVKLLKNWRQLSLTELLACPHMSSMDNGQYLAHKIQKHLNECYDEPPSEWLHEQFTKAKLDERSWFSIR